ncbi:hypothetical protein BASA81_014010 [Batrachochytrium salamandrivorans]|nr:hypothetical protein BASA81_014010 [Batrachochytrium salamandrivorans]
MRALSKRTVELEAEQVGTVQFVRDEERKGFVVIRSRRNGVENGIRVNDLVIEVNGNKTEHMLQREFDVILESCETWPVPLKVLGKQQKEEVVISSDDDGEVLVTANPSSDETSLFQNLWPILSEKGWIKRRSKNGVRFRIPTTMKQGYVLKHGEDYVSTELEVVEYCRANGINATSPLSITVGKEEEEEVKPARTRNLKRAPKKDDGDEFDFVPRVNTAAAAAKEEEEDGSNKKRKKLSTTTAKSKKRRRKAKDSEEEEEMSESTEDEEIAKVILVEEDEVVIAEKEQQILPQLRPRTRGAAKRETDELADLVRQIDEQHFTPAGRSKRLSKEERELEFKLKLPRSCPQIPIITSCAKPMHACLPKPIAGVAMDETNNGQIDLTLSSDEEGEAALMMTVDVENDHVATTTTTTTTAIRFQRGQIVQTRYGIASVRYDYDSSRDNFLQVLFLWDMRQQIFPFGFLNLNTEPIVLDCTKQMVLPKLHMNRSDLARLWPGMYLNDTLINYFLSRLCDLDLPSMLQSRVHVMTTHFFSKLTSRQMNDVKSWTKNVDVFSKDFIIVPVNEAEHWSLAIICFPGNLLPVTTVTKYTEIALELDSNVNHDDECLNVLHNVINQVVANEEQRVPIILKLDSTRSHPTKIVADLLRKWITQESKWKREYDLQVSASAFPVVVPQVPLQDNGCDCGVFLLAFAQHFLTELAWRFVSNEDAIRKRFKHEFGLEWFSTTQILIMRENMHEHIVALAAAAVAAATTTRRMEDD